MDCLTPRIAKEIVSHEAIVQEAYKDSVGVWTWGVGVTNASGHIVFPRYKDNPQTIERCLEIYIWLLKEKYLPTVLDAFRGVDLTENQLGGALSFHYNTGAIKTAEWVRFFKQGAVNSAKESIMRWRSPPSIIGRRTKERDLFFSNKWSNDGKTNVYPVKKPSYSPDWGKVKRVDVSQIIDRLVK